MLYAAHALQDLLLHEKSNSVDVWLKFQGKVTLNEVIATLEKEKGVKISFEDLSVVVLVNGRHVEFIGVSAHGLRTWMKL